MNPETHAAPEPPARAHRSESSKTGSVQRGRTVLTILVLAGIWLLVFNQLRLEWTVNTLYAYGWAIPALALYLFWERWQCRPSPRLEGDKAPMIAAAVCLAAYFPIRAVQEANPDWLLISWAMTALAAGVTLAAFRYAGGFRWSRHFLFPVFFTFTAVAWPVSFENFILQNLMQGNAALVAEVLTLTGMPTFVQGNILSVGGNVLGVDEACSGIRSLQTAFMVSLFFGEFYRLGWIGRAWLVALSFVVASVLNFGRTLTLSWLGGRRGSEALEEWHDPLGFVVLGLCLVGLWALALLMARKSGDSAGQPQPAATAFPLARPLPWLFLALAAVWLLLSELTTEAWYRIHEYKSKPALAWSIQFPSSAQGFQEHSFSENVQTILKYNEGRSASWKSAEGFQWSVYFLRWEPGRVSKNLATAHSPDICLPATGLDLEAELGTTVVDVGDLRMPFRIYHFKDRRNSYYVFHSLMEDVERDLAIESKNRELSREFRLRSVLNGERNLGQRVLGISLHGPIDAIEAEAALTRQLQEIVIAPTATFDSQSNF